jgi:hypothetical protein
MRPGRALVPYGAAGPPAIDDACTTARTVATGPTSVCSVSGANAGNDGEKSRDQQGSHTALLLLADSNACQKLEVPPDKPKLSEAMRRLVELGLNQQNSIT